eukprot:TRINITY_DN17356_c0_g4_i1.p1 TRINITY_DN17356_c0_g4~~TRINITY_DN17356_c0_g4_i1.p1  ORF type:complete len:450 (+),score=93.20 TRINITY_DN17356_c0_g4_i1:110-1459(+)
MGRSGAKERKPRMRLAPVAGDGLGLGVARSGNWPRKAEMRRTDAGPGTGSNLGCSTQTKGSEETRTECQRAHGNEQAVVLTNSVGSQTTGPACSGGCQAVPALLECLSELRAQSAAREAALRAELAAAGERAERAEAEAAHLLLLLNVERAAGRLVGDEQRARSVLEEAAGDSTPQWAPARLQQEGTDSGTGQSPRARATADAVSPERRDAAAVMAAPVTPSQSPEWSSAELTPAPSALSENDDGVATGALRLDGSSGTVAVSSTAAVVDDPGDPSGETGPRPPSQAAEALLIDDIAHWVALFVRRDWARVCSGAARSVLGVLFADHGIWASAWLSIGRFQSVGFEHPTDTEEFGTELGPLRVARLAVDKLAEDMMPLRTLRNIRWFNRWRLRMYLLAHLYEEMRLKHRELWSTARLMVVDLEDVIITLRSTLEMHDRRVSAAEDADTD